MTNMVTLQGKTFDLTGTLPLLLGDWENLEDLGITPTQLQSPKFKEMRIYLTYILRKVDPEISDEFVSKLSMTDIANLNKVAAQLEEGDGGPLDSGDTPTSSGEPTDGPQT